MTRKEAKMIARKLEKSNCAAIEIRQAYPEGTFSVWALDRTRSPMLCSSVTEYETYYPEKA